MGSDVYDYCRGCLNCQQNKDSRKKPLEIPQTLQLPTRRWGSIAMDFVAHLPKAEAGFDCITTFEDRFSKTVHVVPSKETDSATDVAECFFEHFFRLHRPPDSVVLYPDHKLTS